MRLLAAAVLAALLSSPAHAAHVDKKVHHLAIQIDEGNPEVMSLVLNNAVNVVREFEGRGEQVEIEIVAYGPGLTMLRPDKSPVAERVKNIAASVPAISFSACGNTIKAVEKNEGRPITVIPEATVVPAGVVRLMELQEQGWTYVRP